MSGRAVNKCCRWREIDLWQFLTTRASAARRRQILRRSAEQNRQRIGGGAARFDEGGECRAKTIDRDALLRNFETGNAALGKACFDDAENFFGVFEIEFGDADAVIEAQDLRIKISHVGGDHEAQRIAIELVASSRKSADCAELRFLPQRSTS